MYLDIPRQRECWSKNCACGRCRAARSALSLMSCSCLSDMLRSVLLSAVLSLVGAQPFPCPKTCKCVVRDAVQCSGGSVAHIAELGLPTNLTHILLFRMDRGVLQSHSFSGMTVLQRLMLSDSHISAIDPGTFNDLVKLKTLRLTRNKISHLPRAILDKMVLLEQLFLDHNALRDLDQNLFQKLLNLRDLCLNQNQLSFLPASSPVPRLQVFNMPSKLWQLQK